MYNVVVDAVIPEDDPILQLLGLPRYDHCSFALNNSLYIFGGNQEQQVSSTTTTLESIRLNFTTIDTPPVMDILLNENQTASTALLNNITLGAGCAITSYGHALFLPPHGILSTYNLLTRQWILPDNVQGSPSALASFSNDSTTNTSITPPLPETTITAANNNTDRRRDLMVSAMWNDRWVIFGGRLAENNNNFTQDTFILDARMTTPWVWFESPMTVNTPPAPTFTSRGTMVATSRWILYFAITANSTTTATTPITTPFDNINNRPYNVAVYCFDPIVLLWIGQIANFTSPTNQLKAATFGSDSVLIVPASSSSPNTITTTTTTMATTMTSVPNSNSNSSNNNKLGQQQRIVLSPQGLWRLDMSPDIAAGTIHWINNAGPFRPLIGGTMARLTNDLIIFYGGIPFSHDSLRFWNTTSGLFIDPGWWRNTQWNPRPTFRPTNNNEQEEGSPNILAIVLGTVLGSLGFIILIIIICYFCCYRKRRRHGSSRSRSTNTPPTGRQRSVTPMSVQTNFSSFLWSNNNNVTIAGRPYSPPDNNNNSNNNNINNEEMMNDSEDARTWATHLRRTLSAVAHKNRVRWSRSSPQPQSSAALHYHQDMTQNSPGSDRPMISSPIAEGSKTSTNYCYDNTHSQNNRKLDLSIAVIDTERQKRIRKSSRFNEHFDLLAPPEYM